MLVRSKARRIPIIDQDEESHRDILVSVVTQYRILKFIAINAVGITKLQKPLRQLRLGTYKDLATVRMSASVIQVVQLLVARNVSSIPITDDEGRSIAQLLSPVLTFNVGVVLNVFESVDIIPLIKDCEFEEQLNQSVGQALLKRPDVCRMPAGRASDTDLNEDFPGIYTCTLNDTLDNIFDTLRRARVHRFVVVDEQLRLVGALTLSDILRYVLTEGEQDWE